MIFKQNICTSFCTDRVPVTTGGEMFESKNGIQLNNIQRLQLKTSQNQLWENMTRVEGAQFNGNHGADSAPGWGTCTEKRGRHRRVTLVSAAVASAWTQTDLASKKSYSRHEFLTYLETNLQVFPRQAGAASNAQFCSSNFPGIALMPVAWCSRACSCNLPSSRTSPDMRGSWWDSCLPNSYIQQLQKDFHLFSDHRNWFLCYGLSVVGECLVLESLLSDVP